jgi:cobaltochelatase CobS
MPNIKYKPFALTTALCYQCGKEITQGQFNWSYNTRKAGMFRHADCTLSESEFLERIKPTEETTKPEETEETVIDEMVAFVETHVDITEKIEVSNKHKQTKLIKTLLKLREYPFLYGAPGAGKTHLATSIADDMGLNCVVISCSPDMFKSEILGSVSPVTGNYHGTSFRTAWEKGGLILFDEVGLAAGAFLNILNAGLAQNELRFPDGKRVKKHNNCFIMFADNSALYGNDPNFPERQDSGTAFRDRLSYVKFEYDTRLELQIIKIRFAGNNDARANNWNAAVQAMRAEVDKLNVPVFVSPRFAYAGAKAFLAGLSFSQVIDIYLLRGINGDISKLVKSAIASFDRNY